MGYTEWQMAICHKIESAETTIQWVLRWPIGIYIRWSATTSDSLFMCHFYGCSVMASYAFRCAVFMALAAYAISQQTPAINGALVQEILMPPKTIQIVRISFNSIQTRSGYCVDYIVHMQHSWCRRQKKS